MDAHGGGEVIPCVIEIYIRFVRAAEDRFGGTLDNYFVILVCRALSGEEHRQALILPQHISQVMRT